MNDIKKLKARLAKAKVLINAAEDTDNLPALEQLYPAANAIKRKIDAIEGKTVQPAKPAVRMPYVNYVTGRLIWP